MKLPWWLPIGNAPQVTPAQLKGWLDEGRPLQLADARTATEYQQGTIGRARHAPVTAMPASIEKLKLDRRVPVVVLCLSGHRSLPGTRLAAGARLRGVQSARGNYALEPVRVWVGTGRRRHGLKSG